MLIVFNEFMTSSFSVLIRVAMQDHKFYAYCVKGVQIELSLVLVNLQRWRLIQILQQ